MKDAPKPASVIAGKPDNPEIFIAQGAPAGDNLISYVRLSPKQYRHQHLHAATLTQKKHRNFNEGRKIEQAP